MTEQNTKERWEVSDVKVISRKVVPVTKIGTTAEVRKQRARTSRLAFMIGEWV